MRKFRTWFYNLIRPLFVGNIDPNEDFICGNCGRAVLYRQLFCDEVCDRYFHHNTGTIKWE